MQELAVYTELQLSGKTDKRDLRISQEEQSFPFSLESRFYSENSLLYYF